MREEVISSGDTVDLTPAASSAGASSPTVPTNIGSIDLSSHAHGPHGSKAASVSCVGSQQPRTSLSTSAGGSALGSSLPSCRPWERGDLLRRLATFKPSYWSGKPKISSSLACAQRGWMNVDVDKIICESCGSSRSFVLLPSWSADEVEAAGVAFAKQLDAGHDATCPWRGNSCPESLVQFPPTPQSALIGGYKDRCDGLLQFQSLPVIAASAVEQMKISHDLQVEYFLSHSSTTRDLDYKADSIPELEISRDGAVCSYSRAQKLISLCGWEPRWLPNIQDCEEHSAQSARNGCSVGPAQAQINSLQDPSANKNVLPATAKKNTGKGKMLAESRYELRSPLLDCNLCGTSVRISDFLTVPRPARLTPSNIDIPDTSKKGALTRGVSAASGISGWVAADDVDREQTVDRDEVATTNEGKLLPNTEMDLNLTMAGGLSYTHGRAEMSDYSHDAYMGRDLIIGQPSSSEVGDRAASYESRGPSSRKRHLERGGSSNARPPLRMQQADSIEETIIDRDGYEVTDEGQYSAGPSKRVRDSDIFDTYCSSYQRESSGAGPSHSLGNETYADANIVSSFRQGGDQYFGILSARDSARASSVIAMDTMGHSSNDDSMESVENYPGDVDDVQFPSSSINGNLDINETSELNYSNQAQQSICFQPAAGAPREMGGSTTIDGGELFNAVTTTAQARDGFSFGISGGSVGMCASHEAEIHGTDASVHRANSVVGDVEPRIEDAENQGQTGESVAVPGLMDEIVPDEPNREDPHGDSQEMFSRSVGRGDSGSKFDGYMKDESVESGQKPNPSHKIAEGIHAHPSLSCNAIVMGHQTSNRVIRDGTASHTKYYTYSESECVAADGTGALKGESNYGEATEFDPIIYHNQFCPWVNGNVATAGCSNSSANADAIALCGWQLTLDALDTLRSLGHIPIPTLQSESAASLYKDDNLTPGKNLKHLSSVNKSHGQHSGQP